MSITSVGAGFVVLLVWWWEADDVPELRWRVAGSSWGCHT